MCAPSVAIDTIMPVETIIFERISNCAIFIFLCVLCFCYASIIHRSADLSIAFSIKSEKKAKKIAVDFAEKNRYVLPLFFL